tara:strand:- start:999 stop:1493 length:495 start_codon:yes stop_codon:yes gene_type:complete
MNTLLLESLDNYYNESNLNTLTEILNSQSVSLRVIDWFVTNYSKKHNIEYNNNNNIVNVYISYKSQLKSYSKKFFDPFCRRNRINYKQSLSTTIGQLNFFKWALTNGIIDYVTNNYQTIEYDMNNSIIKKNNTNSTGRKKRKELSKSSYKTLTKRNNRIILTFD